MKVLIAPQPDGAHAPRVRLQAAGQGLRSRSVSDAVLCAALDVPAPPARLSAGWQRDMALRLALEPGDVDALPLARTMARRRFAISS